MIFFTPDTGARVVRGAINAAWDKLGGSAGVLGVPTDDEVYRGDVTSARPSPAASCRGTAKTKAFTTTPPELADQLAGLAIPGDATTGDRRRPTGRGRSARARWVPPRDRRVKIGGDGLVQNFAGGKIFYSPATGANVMTGQVLAKYESVGGPAGDLGFPTQQRGRRRPGPDESDRHLRRSGSAGHLLDARLRRRHRARRDERRVDQARGSGRRARRAHRRSDRERRRRHPEVQRRRDLLDKSTKKFTTEPANLASSLTGLRCRATRLPQGPPAAPASNRRRRRHWYSNLLVAARHHPRSGAGGRDRGRRGAEPATARRPGAAERVRRRFDDHRTTMQTNTTTGPRRFPRLRIRTAARDAGTVTTTLHTRGRACGRCRRTWRRRARGRHPGSRSGDLSDDQDAIDTAPTKIEAEPESDPDGRTRRRPRPGRRRRR